MFELHKEFHIKDFNYFYQSQILWDESMAHSISAFMANNPDYQMVVLSGVQHIISGSGIPQRTYHLNKKEYATLINGEFDDLTMDIGDFIFSPLLYQHPNPQSLGLFLKRKMGR